MGVPRLIDPTQVSSGGFHSCALTDEVICWGGNREGQTDVPDLIKPTKVVAGRHHSCAVTDEGVKCWGDNRYGQLEVPNKLWFKK